MHVKIVNFELGSILLKIKVSAVIGILFFAELSQAAAWPPELPRSGQNVNAVVLEYAVDPYAEVLSSPTGANILRLARTQGVEGDVGAVISQLQRDRLQYQRIVQNLTPTERTQIPRLLKRIQVARTFEAAFVPPIRLTLSDAGGSVVVQPGAAMLALFGGSYGFINFDTRQLTTISNTMNKVVEDTQEDITLNDIFRVPAVVQARLVSGFKAGTLKVQPSDWNQLASGVVRLDLNVSTDQRDKDGLAWLHDQVAGMPVALNKQTTAPLSLRFSYYYSKTLMGDLPDRIQNLLLQANMGFLVGFEIEDEAGNRVTYRLQKRLTQTVDSGQFKAPSGYPKADATVQSLRRKIPQQSGELRTPQLR